MVQYKKTALVIALSSAAALSGAAHAAQISAAGYAVETSANTISNNFTLLSLTGGFLNGNVDVSMAWDGTVFTASGDYTGPGGASNMTLSSRSPLYSQPWTAHDIQVFAPGTYTFDTTLGGGNNETGIQTLAVGAGQLGAHMLFDWNGSFNMDISILWAANGVFGNTAAQQTLTGTAVWNAVSMDGDGDGIPGIAMNTGSPLSSYMANFNLNGITPVPLPGAVWLLGSGLLGILGAVRRRKPGALWCI